MPQCHRFAVKRWMGTLAVVGMLAITGCSGIAPGEPADVSVTSSIQAANPRPVNGTNPLSGRAFYVDPTTSAAVAASTAQPRSEELNIIANTAQFRWIGEERPISGVADYVRRYVNVAEQVGQLPLLTLYAIPHRDCNGFTAGGFDTAGEYQKWVSQVGAGIGTSAAAIVVEPDALTAADCLAPAERQERADLLRYAVDTLTANPNAAVYIDGGHSRWLTPEELARRLQMVGVERARGFSLNVSNFFTTSEEIAYGEKVSQLTNGAHYVIDTSRNGAGPAPDAPLNWCNPPGRAIGPFPTTGTAGAHADAYLWIKHPGQSDGECDRQDPKSGLFMVAYAIDLVRNVGE